MRAGVHAQFETATIVGTVRDGSGAVVPGTTVTLTNSATGVSAARTTGADGTFEFFTVKDGVYVVTAEKSGFSIALLDNVQVQVGGRLRVDLQLPVGQVSEKVEVTATAPLLETESSQRGQVIGGAQMTALPLNGREYSALALLTTGVRPSDLNRGGTGTNREGSFNVNGLRSMFNNFLIDGVDNNAYGTSNQGFSNQVMQPPPDAVSEFKVVTNNESAEYGRGAGATINVAYKSGANALHGNAWEFNRNTVAQRDRLFRPALGPEAAAQPQPVRRRARRTDRAEQGVLLRRLRRLPSDARAGGVLDHCDHRATRGHFFGRRPRSPHRHHLSGRHADSAVAVCLARC